jgi:hypothetical protein
MKKELIKSIAAGTTSINAYIQSGDFDISATRDITGQSKEWQTLEVMENLLCL